MKRFFLIGVIALSVDLYSSSLADDQIKDASPDGKFGMLLTAKEEGGVKIQLIEVSSRKVVLDLGEIGHFGPHAEDWKILWAPDSKHFAFYEPNRRGGDTTVYFRNESGFGPVSLPQLPSCAVPAQKSGKGTSKYLESNIQPKEWLKSGALVVIDDEGWELVDGNSRWCTQTVTIAFDAKHHASVLRVTGKRARHP